MRDDIIYLKAGIKDANLLNKFENAHSSKVLIEGLIFFKKNFMFSLTIIDVDELDNLEEESRIDFIKSLNMKNDIENKIENEMENNKNLKLKKETISEEDVINDDVINNLAECVEMNKDIINNLAEGVEMNKECDIETRIIDNYQKRDNNIPKKIIRKPKSVATYKSEATYKSAISKQECVSLVETSRKKAKQCFINAERASRAAENLRVQAIDAANKLKKYEAIMKTMNDSDSN